MGWHRSRRPGSFPTTPPRQLSAGEAEPTHSLVRCSNPKAERLRSSSSPRRTAPQISRLLSHSTPSQRAVAFSSRKNRLLAHLVAVLPGVQAKAQSERGQIGIQAKTGKEVGRTQRDLRKMCRVRGTCKCGESWNWETPRDERVIRFGFSAPPCPTSSRGDRRASLFKETVMTRSRMFLSSPVTVLRSSCHSSAAP